MDEFLTRADKVKQIEIPTNSRDRVIARPNNEGLGFKYNCYDGEILGEFVSKEMFNQTIKEANKIIESVWKKRKLEETAEYQPKLKYILYLAIGLSIVAFILLLISIVSIDG